MACDDRATATKRIVLAIVGIVGTLLLLSVNHEPDVAHATEAAGSDGNLARTKLQSQTTVTAVGKGDHAREKKEEHNTADAPTSRSGIPVYWIALGSQRQRIVHWKTKQDPVLRSLGLQSDLVLGAPGIEWNLTANTRFFLDCSKISAQGSRSDKDFCDNHKRYFTSVSYDQGACKGRDGERGCMLSHLLAVWRAYVNNDEYAIIAESDITLGPFVETLRKQGLTDAELPDGARDYLLGLERESRYLLEDWPKKKPGPKWNVFDMAAPVSDGYPVVVQLLNSGPECPDRDADRWFKRNTHKDEFESDMYNVLYWQQKCWGAHCLLMNRDHVKLLVEQWMAEERDSDTGSVHLHIQMPSVVPTKGGSPKCVADELVYWGTGSKQRGVSTTLIRTISSASREGHYKTNISEIEQDLHMNSATGYDPNSRSARNQRKEMFEIAHREDAVEGRKS